MVEPKFAFPFALALVRLLRLCTFLLLISFFSFNFRVSNDHIHETVEKFANKCFAPVLEEPSALAGPAVLDSLHKTEAAAVEKREVRAVRR